MQRSMVRRDEARRAFLDTITHRCATETLRPFTDRDYPLISHGPSNDQIAPISIRWQRTCQRKTGRRRKNTHCAVNGIKSRTTSFLSRGTKFSHVYRPRDSPHDCDNIVICPSLDGDTVPEYFHEFLATNSRVYKRRIKRRRNFLFTKSKRARAVFEFSIRALAFLFLIDGTHTFSRSRGRASNDRIFLLSIFQHSSWMDRVHYLPPILPSSSHGSCHVAMHRRVRRMILLPSRDHGTSRVRRARSVRSLSLFFFPSISTPVFRRISTMVAAIRWTPRFPGCRVDKGGRKRGKNREDGIFFPFPRKVVAPWRGMRARNHHE